MSESSELTRAPVPQRGLAPYDPADLRRQLSETYSLSILGKVMVESRSEEEIVRLAATSIPALVPAEVVATALSRDGDISDAEHTRPVSQELAGNLRRLHGKDGQLPHPDFAWNHALALPSPAGNCGYLILGAHHPPTGRQWQLLRELANHAGAALSNAAVHHKVAALNDQLATSLAELAEINRIHEVMTDVAASGAGISGIAEATHRLTGLPTVIEDQFGNILATAGHEEDPPAWAPINAQDRSAIARSAAGDASPVRTEERVMTFARSRLDILGALVVLDPDNAADRHTDLVLEHGATVLAAELSHIRALSQMQVRLGRNLVDDLLTGTDNESAIARAEALGVDLQNTFQVLAVSWESNSADESVESAVEQAATTLQAATLIGRRPHAVILLVQGTASIAPFYDSLAHLLPSASGRVGVSDPCRSPADVARGYREALLAATVRHQPLPRNGPSHYRDLGIFQVLWKGNDPDDLRTYIQRWLGPLLDYDDQHNTELTETLGAYLDCGGNYDLTADTLFIHRSTLRYRLQRIRNLTPHNINDPDSRLNIHIATKANRVDSGPAKKDPMIKNLDERAPRSIH